MNGKGAGTKPNPKGPGPDKPLDHDPQYDVFGDMPQGDADPSLRPSSSSRRTTAPAYSAASPTRPTPWRPSTRFSVFVRYRSSTTTAVLSRMCSLRRPISRPYPAITPSVPLDEMNPETGQAAKKSASIDIDRPDAVDDALFNEILWEMIKGRAPLPFFVDTSR